MKLDNYNWQAWIFDLDDTLLDTSRLLIPAAAARACQFLVDQKVVPSFEIAMASWQMLRQKLSGVDLLTQVIVENQNSEANPNNHSPSKQLEFNPIQALAQQAYAIFRTPLLPKTLSLIEGSKEILEAAQLQFPLFLVTQGDIETQIKKVELLGIINLFKHVYYIDPFNGESKQQAFRTILQNYQFFPKHVLSIGNRLNNEIAMSKKEGMQTCYIRYGEHETESPMTPEEIPDFEIKSPRDLARFLAPRKEAL